MKPACELNIHPSAGFSIVDVMVGMVISLIGIVIMFQVFSVSESIRRTTVSGGEAMQNGAVGLYMVERVVRQAGYGIFDSANIPPYPADPANTARVAIAAGTVTTSDSITVTYRPNWEFAAFPPDPAVFASAVPPTLVQEAISINGQAQLVSSINGVISEGIVMMKAQYGTDANGNGLVDSTEWSQAAPATPKSVMAVRLALVARSVQPEKPGVQGGACDATTTLPTWRGSAALPLDVSAGLGLAVTDSWKCYRYKTFENLVPIRN